MPKKSTPFFVPNKIPTITYFPITPLPPSPSSINTKTCNENKYQANARYTYKLTPQIGRTINLIIGSQKVSKALVTHSRFTPWKRMIKNVYFPWRFLKYLLSIHIFTLRSISPFIHGSWK